MKILIIETKRSSKRKELKLKIHLKKSIKIKRFLNERIKTKKSILKKTRVKLKKSKLN